MAADIEILKIDIDFDFTDKCFHMKIDANKR